MTDLPAQAGGNVVSNSWRYQVDGEVGRFEFVTHPSVHDGKTVSNTAREVCPGLRRWERYKTSGFKELAYSDGALEESYRKTSRLITRIRSQPDDGTPSRSVPEQADGEGARLMQAQAIEHKAEQILKAHEFSEDGMFEGEPETYHGQEPVSRPDDRVAKALARCQARVKVDGDLSEDPVAYEAPECTVKISVDDVGVKRPKAERAFQDKEAGEPERGREAEKKVEKKAEKRKRKYGHHTVVPIEKDSQSSIVNGHGIKHVLSVLSAFLLNSDLLQSRLQVFTDGYTILHDVIQRCFSWYPNLAMILDWYHPEEKGKIQLRLAMKGRMIRNEVLSEWLPLLWYGLVDQAIAYVKTLDRSQIKAPEAIKTLIRSFERNRVYIPCYAVRKEPGLRNSSTIGEKMTDLVVSDRQKHHGMSWSLTGSVALASLTA